MKTSTIYAGLVVRPRDGTLQAGVVDHHSEQQAWVRWNNFATTKKPKQEWVDWKDLEVLWTSRVVDKDGNVLAPMVEYFEAKNFQTRVLLVAKAKRRSRP